MTPYSYSVEQEVNMPTQARTIQFCMLEIWNCVRENLAGCFNWKVMFGSHAAEEKKLMGRESDKGIRIGEQGGSEAGESTGS